MRIELICIGTELLEDRLNTNVVYIGEKLKSIGLNLARQITVADDKKEIEEVLRQAISRSDMVITTGGLGPTFDDLTRETVAKVLKKKLVFKREVMEAIAMWFAVRDLKMPKDNERQAYIIKGARVIPNKVGTAPGMIIELGGKRKALGGEQTRLTPHSSRLTVISLPGPPRELRPMMEEVVLPYLKEKYEQRIAKSCVLHICGLTESEVAEKIKPIIESEREMIGGEVKFAILAHFSVIDLKIEVRGSNELLINETLLAIQREFYDCLGERIYGKDEQTLEGVVGQLLGSKRKTLGVAESCTGGLVGHKITNIAGSSIYFKGSIVAYSNQAKIKILGVAEKVLSKYGAVSNQVALQMAVGARRITRADFGLATTGIAGPGGATKTKPVGLVYIALTSDKGNVSREFKFTGTRLEIKEKVSSTALDLLRKYLLKNYGTAD